MADAAQRGSVAALSGVEAGRLRAELAAAREEIVGLRAEIARLRAGQAVVATISAHRSQRAPSLFPTVAGPAGGVDRASAAELKVALFRSLFAGRADIYVL